MKNSVLMALACLSFSACRYEATGEDGLPNTTTFHALPSNEEVLAKAYDSTFHVPDGFYVDERAGTPVSYSLYHVKDVSGSYELCTDDFDEARTWESSDNASRAVNGTYVSSRETDMYFEFVRDLSYPDDIGNVPGGTSPGFARVFRCSYVNRDGADRNLRNGYAGMLNVSTLSEDSITTYAEYMWQFTFFWPAQKKVLDSYSEESGNEFENTLLLTLVTSQGSERCDLVEVVEWTFSVDRTTGYITKRFQPVFQMEAMLVNGIPTECAI